MVDKWWREGIILFQSEIENDIVHSHFLSIAFNDLTSTFSSIHFVIANDFAFFPTISDRALKANYMRLIQNILKL